MEFQRGRHPKPKQSYSEEGPPIDARPRVYPKPRHSNSEEGPAPGEQRYRQMGFTRGFSLGEEVGWRDGYQLGLQRGAQIATELGFYQGFVHAWITVLEREEIAKQRKMVALKALLEMTKNFPQVNIADEDMFEKLHKIRAKFKQVVAILNINTQESELHPEGEPSSPRPEMSF
ncbi:protein LTO1 homolog isoform X1 [Dermacentor silvarum]|uniref:protein LTO1 homolog isoform X1 n=1 Tax=Dermacentor silvarum TaxID=543639 RepID=UPI00189A1844|nr:protein LTO1 homolog isoform X1 [Dermacentor silvarum]